MSKAFLAESPSSGGRRVTLFVLASVLYFAGRAPYLGQWDSFDYLKQIVTHQLSDLGFGRPVFIGYNILLWETAKRLFRLMPLDVEWVVMAGIVLTGALGMLLFERFARQLLPGRPARLAVMGLLLSPLYATYSGFIMTEVPMIVATVAAGSILWATKERHRAAGALAGGMLFGFAVGIREQAVTFGAAFLWILWVRRPDTRARLEGWFFFGVSAFAAIIAPILALYVNNPTWFAQRTGIWLRAIPMGEVHFWRNLEASLVFAFAACPGAWLALIGAALCHWRRRYRTRTSPASPGHAPEMPADGGSPGLPHPLWGLFCCVILPVAALWRDADVQIHPRYAMVVLPGAVILCASLYHRWFPSMKAALAWTVLQVLVFAVAQAGIQPLRQMQQEKKDYASRVLKCVPDGGLLIPGGYSPILDYYRGIGIKPHWRLLWSGWGWNRKIAEAAIRDSWSRHEPVYLCEGPYGWLYFEDEWLDLYFLFKGCRRQAVARGIEIILPP